MWPCVTQRLCGSDITVAVSPLLLQYGSGIYHDLTWTCVTIVLTTSAKNKRASHAIFIVHEGSSSSNLTTAVRSTTDQPVK